MQNQINLNIEKFVVTAPRAIEGTNIKPGSVLELIPADLSKPLDGVYFLTLIGIDFSSLCKVSKYKNRKNKFYCTFRTLGDTITITPSDIENVYQATKTISSPVI